MESLYYNNPKPLTPIVYMSKTLVKCVSDSQFGENTYLLHKENNSSCVIIDPGLEPEIIIDSLEQNQLTPVAILCTHGHLDHVAGITVLKKKYPDCPVYIGELDADKLGNPRGNLSADFGFSIVVQPADKLLKDGDTLSIGSMEFEVRLTPGHSAGHVTYIEKSDQSPDSTLLVFCGDVLFCEGIGRSDFYDGDSTALIDSIETKLLVLPPQTRVFPGHGPETTIEHEKIYNPYF